MSIFAKSPQPKKAPLVNLPIINTAFEYISCDIVGPLPQCQDTGNRLIFFTIDLCTRYPIAIALPRHTAEDIENALLSIFCQFEVCRHIQSDNGNDLSSHLWREVMQIFRVKHSFSTIFHPEIQGTLERFHKIMKSMITGLVEIYSNNWDRCLPVVLWSYRECPVEALSFSQFELLFGRSPSGPLSLLKDTWLSKPSKEENKKTCIYLRHEIT